MCRLGVWTDPAGPWDWRGRVGCASSPSFPCSPPSTSTRTTWNGSRRGGANDVILHEFGHALGIGPSWRDLGLLRWVDSPGIAVDRYFAGPLAIAAFDSAGGTDYHNAKVPVEIRGAVGSVDSHWRESVLGPELMTSLQDRGADDPLSAITIWSLADLGYTVDASLAEEYSLPGTGGQAADVPKRQRARTLDLTGDILSPTLLIFDRDGRVVRRVIRN